jgi:hypothetical protein
MALGESPETAAAARRPRGSACLLAAALAAACTTPTPPAAPVGTVARARQNYRASIGSCQEVRESRLNTLGPPVFQPISGDQPFNECLARAKTHLDVELSEAD